MIYFLGVILVIVIDQLSKWMIVNKMALYESIPLINGWLHITSTRNRGAAFSILQNQRWFFIVLTFIVVAFLSYYLLKIYKVQKLLAFSLMLIIGGAIGNLIDRMLTGAVIDFIDVRIINFAIFNIADSAIVVGVGLLILDMFINKNNPILT